MLGGASSYNVCAWFSLPQQFWFVCAAYYTERELHILLIPVQPSPCYLKYRRTSIKLSFTHCLRNCHGFFSVLSMGQFCSHAVSYFCWLSRGSVFNMKMLSWVPGELVSDKDHNAPPAVSRNLPRVRKTSFGMCSSDLQNAPQGLTSMCKCLCDLPAPHFYFESRSV